MAEIEVDAFMAPGTVLLQDLESKDKRIVLHPVPTNNPNDPLNWSRPRKALHFTLVLFFVLFTFVFLDIVGTAYSSYVDEFGLDFEGYNIMTGMNWLGLAVGAVLFIPFVYKFGRRPVYLFCLTVQLACAVWSAKAETTADLIASNLVMGLGGAISETIVMITIGDLFFVHQYATMSGLFLLMQIVGSTLGPLAAGYVVVSQGWRWIWWWCAIFLGANLVAVLLFFEESTFAIVMARHRRPATEAEVEAEAEADADAEVDAEADAAAVVDQNKVGVSTVVHAAASHTVDYNIPQSTYRERLALFTVADVSVLHHFYQPFVVMVKLPAVAYAAITYGTLLGWFVVMTNVQSTYLYYEPWNFDAAGVGLFSVAAFVGTVLGAAAAPCMDWMILWLARRNGGVYEPEMRLWPVLPASFVLAGGILIFGLGVAKGASWIVLAVGSAFFSAGFMVIGDVALTYISDSYHNVLGDALVAITVMRNAISTIFSFCLTNWIDGMGLQNTFVLVTVLAFAISLLPLAILQWGKQVRVRTAPAYEHFSRRQANRRVF